MFAVIRIAILKDDIAGLCETRAKYKQEGVDDGFLIKQSACDAAKDGLSLLASIPVFVAIYGFVYVNQIKKGCDNGRMADIAQAWQDILILNGGGGNEAGSDTALRPSI